MLLALKPLFVYLSGQGESEAIYANIKFVDNKTGIVQRKEQLKKPFRITVTKSEVLINYPLRYETVSCRKPLAKPTSLFVGAQQSHLCSLHLYTVYR